MDGAYQSIPGDEGGPFGGGPVGVKGSLNNPFPSSASVASSTTTRAQLERNKDLFKEAHRGNGSSNGGWLYRTLWCGKKDRRKHPAPGMRTAKSLALEGFDFDDHTSPINESHLRAVSAWQWKRVACTRWVLNFLIGCVVASVAALIIWCTRQLTHLKFNAVYSLVAKENNGDLPFGVAFLVFWLIGLSYALTAAIPVVFVEPAAAGGGIAELKMTLNGVKIPRFVRFKTLICRVLSNIFSVSSGLPSGYEGPMLAVGGAVGAGLSQGKSTTLGFDTRWSYLAAMRTDKEKRDFTACGASAGLAAAFNSPIGGTLFAYEETSSFWSKSLTWRAFFTAVVGAYVIAIFLSGMLGEWGSLNNPGMFSFGSFTSTGQASASWSFWEIPLFMLLGAIGGLFGALFVQVNKFIMRFRLRKVNNKRLYRLLDVAFVHTLTSIFAFIIPWKLGYCSPIPTDESKTVTETLVSFYCPAGQYNDIASFWFTSTEESIRLFYHVSNKNPFDPIHLTIFFFVYTALMCLSAGTSVSAGLFIPTLLSGSALGRLVGRLTNYTLNPLGLSVDAGTYSLIGSAAMLGGTTRMAVSIAVILLEATGNYSFGLPIMVVLIMARLTGNIFSPGIYDMQIEERKWPLLEDKVKKTIAHELRACDVMTKEVLVFQEVEQVGRVVNTLQKTDYNGFPVVFSEAMLGSHPRLGTLAGYIQRKHLAVILANRAFHAELPTERFDRMMIDGSSNGNGNGNGEGGPGAGGADAGDGAAGIDGIAGAASSTAVVGARQPSVSGGGALTLSSNGDGSNAGGDSGNGGGGGGGSSGTIVDESFESPEVSRHYPMVVTAARPTATTIKAAAAAVPGTAVPAAAAAAAAPSFGAVASERSAVAMSSGIDLSSALSAAGAAPSSPALAPAPSPPVPAVAGAVAGGPSGSGNTQSSNASVVGGGARERSSVRFADKAPLVAGSGADPTVSNASALVAARTGRTSGSSTSVRAIRVPTNSIINSLALSPVRTPAGSTAAAGTTGSPVPLAPPPGVVGGTGVGAGYEQAWFGVADREKSSTSVFSTFSTVTAPPTLLSAASFVVGSTRRLPAPLVPSSSSFASSSLGASAAAGTFSSPLVPGRRRGSSGSITTSPPLVRAASSTMASSHRMAPIGELPGSAATTGGSPATGGTSSSSGAPFGEGPVPADSLELEEAVSVAMSQGAGMANATGTTISPANAATVAAAIEQQKALFEPVHSAALYHALYDGEARYPDEPLLLWVDFEASYPRYPDVRSLKFTPEQRSMFIDLRPYMDPCPLTVHVHTPLQRAYRLFREMGLRHLMVVNNCHDVVGIISRNNLTHESLLECYETVMWNAEERAIAKKKRELLRRQRQAEQEAAARAARGLGGGGKSKVSKNPLSWLSSLSLFGSSSSVVEDRAASVSAPLLSSPGSSSSLSYAAAGSGAAAAAVVGAATSTPEAAEKDGRLQYTSLADEGFLRTGARHNDDDEHEREDARSVMSGVSASVTAPMPISRALSNPSVSAASQRGTRAVRGWGLGSLFSRSTGKRRDSSTNVGSPTTGTSLTPIRSHTSGSINGGGVGVGGGMGGIGGRVAASGIVHSSSSAALHHRAHPSALHPAATATGAIGAFGHLHQAHQHQRGVVAGVKYTQYDDEVALADDPDVAPPLGGGGGGGGGAAGIGHGGIGGERDGNETDSDSDVEGRYNPFA